MANIAVVSTAGNPKPYQFFGVFADLPFWPGGLTLLASAPGIGKTSWLLRMIRDAGADGFPAMIGCYEHTPEELKYRMYMQSQAAVSGPHGEASEQAAAAYLAEAGNTALVQLDHQRDTTRALEELIIEDLHFPTNRPALIAVDYIQRVPVVGTFGLISEEQRAGEAAARLRELGRKRGWAIIAASALKADAFDDASNLGSLLGDERLPYEADRILIIEREGIMSDCGCVSLSVRTLKDRTGPATTWDMAFWGERFFPAFGEEMKAHGGAAVYV